MFNMFMFVGLNAQTLGSQIVCHLNSNLLVVYSSDYTER